jgi:tetratricopeptide (TPR) repeat protein
MKLKYLVNLLVAMSWSAFVSGQQTDYYTNQEFQYRRGIELYGQGKYSAAQGILDDYLKIHSRENSDLVSNCEFYSSMCAVKLFNNDAESRVLDFLGKNPENPLRNDAIFNLANYFYQRKNSSSALEYYNQVDKNRLSRDDQAEFYFKSGYCYFQLENYDKARLAFSQIKDLDTKYASPALYYYSHINYTQGNYETALEGFLKLKTDANFGPIVPYYLTQIYYKQKKYDEVIRYAPTLMENVSEKRAPEVSRITGESYAQLNLYAEAIPYLEKYMATSGSTTKEDKYTLAYAYYKTNDYAKASDLFGQITGTETALSQNALYHLADCHLKLNDKNKARMAFSSAAKMKFDPAIQEDALFNSALLTYELDYSPFNEAIQALNEYLDRYPNSRRNDEANNYLVMAYLNAKNYSMALTSIDKIRDKNNEIKKAYQKIAYYRGLELFSNNNFAESIELLSSSTRYGNFDSKLYALSLYWKGEAYYRSSDFQKAIENYSSFLSQPGVNKFNEYYPAQYNLGYCYFSLRQYTDASLWFSRFTGSGTNQHQEILTDGFNRLGDCYFVQMDYNRAVTYYDLAIKNGRGNTDYALFQKSLALGVTGKDNEKINTLNQLVNNSPNSTLKADVLFQMAESYVKLNQQDKALAAYKKVVTDYPKSSYVKKSLLGLGLLYYNANRNNEAIQCYKQIITDYPGTAEAENALIGLKNVYVDMNDVDSYYTYVNGIGVLTSSDLIEQDSLSYYAAEKIYMSGDYSKAVLSFKNYIEKHPDGRFLLNANFYNGDCNYRANNYDAAITSFNYVIGRPQSRFMEPALLGASRIKFRLKDYQAAAEYYAKLEDVAEVKGNLLEARMGLLKCFMELNDFAKVSDMADKILLTEKLSPEQERETRFAKAKSLLARDRQMLALEEFKKLAVEVKTSEGAESKFRVAEIYYQRKEIANAEKEISEFADKTTPHQYWMAKSFLLWADIFRDKGDDFQAIQTLQSLIDYYEKTDDGILAEAKEKKKLLTERQEKTGKATVQPEEEIQMK